MTTYRNIEALTSPLLIGNGEGRVRIDVGGAILLQEDAQKLGVIPVSLMAAKMNLPAGKVSIDYDEGYAVFAPGGLIGNTADRLMVTVQYPYNGLVGGVISPVIRFVQDTANNTEFTIQFRIQPDGGGTPSTAWGGGSTDIATAGLYEYTGSPIIQHVRLGTMSLAGFGEYPTIQGMITRSDGLAGDISALSIGVEYAIDKIGR